MIPVLFLASCSQTVVFQKITRNSLTTVFAYEDCCPTELVSLENVKSIHLIDDSLALVTLPETTSGVLSFVTNLNSGAIVREFIRRGTDDGNMISCKTAVTETEIIFHDAVTRKLCYVSRDKLLDGELIWYSYEYPLQCMRPYKGHFLGLNPYCFSDKESHIKGENARFIISEELTERGMCGNIDTYNVVIGSFLISEKKDRIVYFDNNSSFVEVYDYDLNPLCRADGPDKYKIQYYVSKSAGKKNVSFYDCYPFAYGENCCDSSFLYALYWGKLYSSYEEYCEDSAVIVRFDWDGNIVDGIRIPPGAKNISCSWNEIGKVFISFRDGLSNSMHVTSYEFPKS